MDTVKFPKDIDERALNEFKIFWLGLTELDWRALVTEWLGNQSKALKRMNFAEWIIKTKMFKEA